MKKGLLKIWYVLIHMVFAFFCLATVPFYLVSYPFVWLFSGFKHIPWWWTATDWIEDKLPPHEEIVVA